MKIKQIYNKTSLASHHIEVEYNGKDYGYIVEVLTTEDSTIVVNCSTYRDYEDLKKSDKKKILEFIKHHFNTETKE